MASGGQGLWVNTVMLEIKGFGGYVRGLEKRDFILGQQKATDISTRSVPWDLCARSKRSGQGARLGWQVAGGNGRNGEETEF